MERPDARPQLFEQAEYVVDVTLPVRFQLEKESLKIGKVDKAHLLGFFNPVPECLKMGPALCLVFARRSSPDEIVVQYFNNLDEVDLH